MERRHIAGRWFRALLLCSVITTTARASVPRVAPDVSSVHIVSQGKTLFGRMFSPALPSAQSKAPGVFMLHGIPGTEQNFDVAYALRDAGFICLLWHYRGCWGSEGSYSIDGIPDDIDSALRSRCLMSLLAAAAAAALLPPLCRRCTSYSFTAMCVRIVCMRGVYAVLRLQTMIASLRCWPYYISRTRIQLLMLQRTPTPVVSND